MGIIDCPIKIFADGADPSRMIWLANDPGIDGFTTNPTLLRQAGITNYREFATSIMAVTDKPISFEVLADDAETMRAQAMLIHGWGPNAYVKIPIVNTHGDTTIALMRDLASDGVKINVTAVTTMAQATQAAHILRGGPPSIVSVFAGRIADTGVDPLPIIHRALDESSQPTEVLWASAREILNIRQASESGCHIITLPYPLIQKARELWGKDLDDYSRETVQMFATDAEAAGLTL